MSTRLIFFNINDIKKKKWKGTLPNVSGVCFRDILMFWYLKSLNDFWRNKKVNSLILSVHLFIFREPETKRSKSTTGETVKASSQTPGQHRSAATAAETSQRRSAWKAAAGGYEHIPSEKSIRSSSRGHESESTECGSDLLYCLIKINLLCPVVRMKDGTSNRRTFSVSSFLTIERRRQLRLQRQRQLDSWRVGGKKDRSSKARDSYD